MSKKVSMAKRRSTQAADKRVSQEPLITSGASMKRLTVDIPEILHTQIKVTCARHKLKINTLVMDGVRHELARYQEEAA